MKLEIKRTFSAPVDAVFKAWTDGGALRSWLSPGGWEFARGEVDVRPGGSYFFELRSEKNERWVMKGNYREVVPGKKLVMTWSTEGEPRVTDTLLTVLFERHGKQTEMRLTHELFPSQEALEEHQGGWSMCMEKLTGFLAR